MNQNQSSKTHLQVVRQNKTIIVYEISYDAYEKIENGEKMPLAKKMNFKCESCGYTEQRTIGDVMPDLNIFKPCPKCGGKMNNIGTSNSNDSSDLLNIVIKNLKKVFK